MLSVNTASPPGYCFSPLQHSPPQAPVGLPYGLPGLTSSVFSPMTIHPHYPMAQLNHLLTTQQMMQSNLIAHPGMTNQSMGQNLSQPLGTSSGFNSLNSSMSVNTFDTKDAGSGKSLGKLVFFFC